GEMTNYEKVTLDMLTDGTIDAATAISRAADILREQFNFFVQTEEVEVVEEKPKKAAKKTAKAKEDKEEEK
ncbi:DNA-directed RNA polymerase subunit alpha, partial [Patescibacteria group bacterium]|nr:DNA-directed RNA polymerase subunit alpha [Patescibacteria group bacterium]